MAKAAPAGYSGKSLQEKLGIKPGMRLAVVGAPKGYDRTLGAPPKLALAWVGELGRLEGEHDLVHLFCRDRAQLEAAGPAALDRIAAGGALWVSWPKKSSKLFRDLTEDGVREVLLPTGWVDVKVCAVDADWSALKFARRKASR